MSRLPIRSSVAVPVQTQRERDLLLLRWVIKHGRRELEKGEFTRVSSILVCVEKAHAGSANSSGLMTPKQREWVQALGMSVDRNINWEDPDCLMDPSARNAQVPIGAPVETPAVLRVLPLKPPGRK